MIAEKRFLDYSVSTAATMYKVLLQVVYLFSVCLTGRWQHLQADLYTLSSLDAVCSVQWRCHELNCSPSACFAISTGTAGARQFHLLLQSAGQC